MRRSKEKYGQEPEIGGGEAIGSTEVGGAF